MNEEGDIIEAPEMSQMDDGQMMDNMLGNDGDMMQQDCNMDGNQPNAARNNEPEIEVGFEEMEAHGFGNYG